jgi:hypothetical protein
MAAIRATQALALGTALAFLRAEVCEARWPSGSMQEAGRLPDGTRGPLTDDLSEAFHT